MSPEHLSQMIISTIPTIPAVVSAAVLVYFFWNLKFNPYGFNSDYKIFARRCLSDNTDIKVIMLCGKSVKIGTARDFLKKQGETIIGLHEFYEIAEKHPTWFDSYSQYIVYEEEGKCKGLWEIKPQGHSTARHCIDFPCKQISTEEDLRYSKVLTRRIQPVKHPNKATPAVV